MLAGAIRSPMWPAVMFYPPEFEDCLVLGYWEDGLIKGKGNASAVGVFVERESGYVMLVKMNNVTAAAAVEGFSASLNRMPLPTQEHDL